MGIGTEALTRRPIPRWSKRKGPQRSRTFFPPEELLINSYSWSSSLMISINLHILQTTKTIPIHPNVKVMYITRSLDKYIMHPQRS
jgi:hypothetical protein